jgi:hypothetical protein
MDRAWELSHPELSNLLLGLGYAAAPFRAEVMARLRDCVHATLLDEGSLAAIIKQAIANTLYALAVLSNLGVYVEARTVQSLVQRAAGLQLLTKEEQQQACAQLSL